MFRAQFSKGEAKAQALETTPPGPSWSINHHTAGRSRVLLLFGSILLLAGTALFFEPAMYWSNDPELFRLLRGMGVIKGVIACIAFAIVWWWLAQPTSERVKRISVMAIWALMLATGLIWQLTMVPLASGLFHIATLTLLVMAWRNTD